MNALLPNAGPLPNALQEYLRNQADGDELGAGITGGFAVISYKGKNWRTKFRGDEKLITRNDVVGDGSKDPAISIEVVIIRASPHISKIFYEKGFTEGDMSPPDCWSVNGVAPDPASAKKQSPTCAGCPKNAFGSKITDAGKKAKACADTKRLAVVPLGDIDNELFGGPMLLRTPAASLKEVKAYSVALNQRGVPYYAVGTRVSFDHNEAFPKLLFEPIRVLTEREVIKILSLRSDDRVNRILEEAVEVARAEVDQPEEPAKGSAFDNLGPVPDIAKATSGVGSETEDEREFREFQEAKARAKAEAEEKERKQAEAQARARAEAEAAAKAAAAAAETPEQREFREFKEAKAAAAAKAAEEAQKEETPEQREFREFKEAKAKAAAGSTTAATEVTPPKKTTTKKGATVAAPVATEAAGGGTPKSFDTLLEGLLPST